MADVRHNAEESRFEIEVDGRLAVAEYRLAAGRMILTHTFVPTELRGGGIAGLLVKAALEHARAAGLRVVPQCGYAETYLRRYPEYADLREG